MDPPVSDISAPLAIVVADTVGNLFGWGKIAVPANLEVPNRFAPLAVVRMDPVTGLVY